MRGPKRNWETGEGGESLGGVRDRVGGARVRVQDGRLSEQATYLPACQSVRGGRVPYLSAYPPDVSSCTPAPAHPHPQAGMPGAVTIATNMAGRGTDIILGGNPEGLTKLALTRLVYRRLLKREEGRGGSGEGGFGKGRGTAGLKGGGKGRNERHGRWEAGGHQGWSEALSGSPP